jgi:hypothetical protein
MKIIEKFMNDHCENMRPGSSIPHTDAFRNSWEIRTSFEAGFIEAIRLSAIRARLAQLEGTLADLRVFSLLDEEI